MAERCRGGNARVVPNAFGAVFYVFFPSFKALTWGIFPDRGRLPQRTRIERAELTEGESEEQNPRVAILCGLVLHSHPLAVHFCLRRYFLSQVSER
ncbi:hypothetical protein Pla52n_43300 [Stieleria varia]|uniref:Uncharacterized protein n=1 Tax=Stieleria varia TaxID=2528005 RepID=A0A5C6AMS6_9BACT|nr:hypothetical protein Pla52n_43300 [Stieleria varia]